jgi:hypothetical protein
MCKQSDSIEQRRKAADDLSQACRHAFPDEISKALHQVYDDTVREGIPDDLKQLVDRLP